MYLLQNLIYLCNKYKISQNKLANDLNLPTSTIKSIFQGKSKNPNLEILSKLRDYFKVSIDDLVFTDLSKTE